MLSFHIISFGFLILQISALGISYKIPKSYNDKLNNTAGLKLQVRESESDFDVEPEDDENDERTTTLRPLSAKLDQELQEFSNTVLKQPIHFENEAHPNFLVGIIRTPAVIISRYAAGLLSRIPGLGGSIAQQTTQAPIKTKNEAINATKITKEPTSTKTPIVDRPWALS